MTNPDMAEVLAEALPAHAEYLTEPILAALAAAATDGPLVAEVECRNCLSVDPASCLVCTGTGTVRLIVHFADPALSEVLAEAAEVVVGIAPSLRTAARIVGGDHE